MRGHLRSITLLLSFSLIAFHSSFAQQKFNYDREWKKVDSLYSVFGLTTSALDVVNNIYAAAKKEKNEPERIKSLLYMMTLQNQKQENAEIKNIQQLEKEVPATMGAARSIMTSILADAYLLYLQQHRYQFYGRTKTTNFKKEDIATWTLEDLHKKVTSLYLESISDEKLLQQTELASFDTIIIKGNVRYLRPTLYDLLAHEALNYFKNDERYLDKPAYAYEIDDPIAFADAKTFTSHNFATKDSFSLHHEAMQLFQRLINFHLNDASPAALIDVDIERISFVKTFGVMENKDSLYEVALRKLTERYPNEKEITHAWYLIADLHATYANSYDPLKDTSNRYEYVVAKQILDRITSPGNVSFEKSEATQLLNRIIKKELQIHTEKVNVPGQPFRILVSYSNVANVNMRIVKYDEKTRDTITRNQNQDQFWLKILTLPSIKTFSQALPATNDYQMHQVEVKVDPLPVGEYALVASTGDFTVNNEEVLALLQLRISNISFISSGENYFVLNRTTGQPMPNVSVTASRRVYNTTTRNYDYKDKQYKTDKNGFVLIKEDPKETDRYMELAFKTADDYYKPAEGIYPYYLNRFNSSTGNEDDEDADDKDRKTYEANNLKIFFFTDRSIYRPGQTVYFKSIVVTKDFKTKLAKIVPGFKSMYYLEDPNSEDVDSIVVVTNEFGSFSGKFKLPQNRLTGEFSIYDDSTDEEFSFSVEEYKRPTFEVQYEKQKGTYRLYDSITVTGTAKAYAGNNIDGALVKYRVNRVARFPYPWLLWGRGWFSSSPQEIAHGEVKTDANGKFNIKFLALPDKGIDKKYEPVFDYSITSDVSDINGETRTGQTQLSVGYKSLLLSVTLPNETMMADSLKQIFVKTTNQSDEFQPSQVTVSFWKLDVPRRMIRDRLWTQPDQFVMTKEEYIKYFPHDEFANESKKEEWKRLGKEYEITDSTKANTRFAIRNAKFSPGWYAIDVITHDKEGNEIKDIKFIQLTNNSGETVVPIYNWVKGNTAISGQPNSNVITTVGSSANDVFVIKFVDKRVKKSSFEFISLNNESKSITVPVEESDRGGFGVFFAFVKDSRFYSTNYGVRVPSNKDLNISYETYRDKTAPGTEEKWKVKITGAKNEKFAAEVLTAMYDASLDQFKPQSWSIPITQPAFYLGSAFWNTNQSFGEDDAFVKYHYIDYPIPQKIYDQLLSPLNAPRMQVRAFNAQPQLEGKVAGINVNPNVGMQEVVVTGYGVQRKTELSGDVSSISLRGIGSVGGSTPLYVVDGVIYTSSIDDLNPADIQQIQVLKGAEATALYGVQGANGVVVITTKSVAKKKEEEPAKIRTNFNETAFFFPQLRTDTAGNVEFSFTMPEALTQWKWMTLAHTKELAFGYATRSVITQKELMLQPNLPRFLREGDLMEVSTKIVNLADSEVTGQVQLLLIDPTTNQSVDGWFQNMYSNQYFTAPAKGSVAAQFSIQIPHQYNKPVIVRLVARAGNVSDGEEHELPVLTNKVLVTETLPLNVRGSGTKEFKFEKLIQSEKSETLQQHALTIEFTSNPSWYAVQALPYLMEFPYECAEQTWNRFYANALGTKIVNSSPKVKAIFEKWKTQDTAAFLSNLEKNQELKSVLLEETPWVMDAKNESEQKKRLALLFDLNKMSSELSNNLDKVVQSQLDNGGFAWFKGGRDNQYITQYILSGLGHLKTIGAIPPQLKNRIDQVLKSALAYTDDRIKDNYDDLVKSKADLNKQQIGTLQIQYLYLRSFFNEQAVPGQSFQAYNYYRKQAQKYWLQQSRYMQGMIALALFRTGDGKTSFDILRSLKQNAIVSEEMGMYWKDVHSGYYWNQAPIETQSLLIEAFATIYKDNKIVDDLKTWLLKNKQTNNWGNSKSTAEACYALLVQGTDWLSNTPVVRIKLGDQTVSSTEQAEAGTGYFKKTFDGQFVTPSMGNISVSVNYTENKTDNKSTNQQINKSTTTWGSAYWQYFENSENIIASATPLSLVKKLFVEKNTDRGPMLEPVADNATFKVGDKVKVRIELRVDRDMEYVHMKDMRAASFEPVDVLSQYKWQDGLGYYQATKDASTNFFFDYLRKGTYVFEYTMFATQVGTFSNGIATIQCMYAPEFSSHSEGLKVVVEGK